ncbi:MAG: ABC transporter permease [Cyclobacteriaceae bacterium]
MRNKIYSSINIFGLALGVACCLLLTLYIQDELGYDKHHARLNHLYRITTEFRADLGFNKFGSSSPPIAMTVKDEIPEVETACRVLSPPGVQKFDQVRR